MNRRRAGASFTFAFHVGARKAFAAIAVGVAIPAVGATPAGAALTFAPFVNFAAGSYPIQPVVGDFNRDGAQDLAVTNQGAQPNVSVLLGTGAGGFGAPTGFPVNFAPGGMAISDFNADGNQDLAMGSGGSNLIQVLLGAGGGSFGAVTTFDSGDQAGQVAVADFNEDGHQDLVATNSTSNQVSLLLGTGSGSFGAAQAFPVAGGASPASPAVGDFNEDGHRDLVVRVSVAVSVLLGTGAGTFQPATSFSTGDMGPFSVRVGEFNGDNHQDLVVSNSGENFVTPGTPGSVAVLLGSGSGTFGTPATFPADKPASLEVADFDGDGRQDVAFTRLAGAAVGTSGAVSVMLGTGAGSLGAASPFTVGTDPRTLTVGEFNGDGRPDIAVTTNPGLDRTIAVLRNAATADPAPASLTFAAQLPGTTSTAQTVTIVNNGSAPLAIAQLTVTGANRDDYLIGPTACAAPVAPGASCAATVRFSPKASGQRSATLTITSNAANATATVALTGTGASSPVSPPSSPPQLTALAMSPSKFRAARSGPSIAAARRGTRVTYRNSQAAITTFTVQRALSGRRSGSSCVKPTARNRRGTRCTRFTRVRGNFTHSDQAGANRFRFTARLAGRSLRPGRYRLNATPRAAGKTGKKRRATFTIIR